MESDAVVRVWSAATRRRFTRALALRRVLRGLNGLDLQIDKIKSETNYFSYSVNHVNRVNCSVPRLCHRQTKAATSRRTPKSASSINYAWIQPRRDHH